MLSKSVFKTCPPSLEYTGGFNISKFFQCYSDEAPDKVQKDFVLNEIQGDFNSLLLEFELRIAMNAINLLLADGKLKQEDLNEAIDRAKVQLES